MSKIQEAIKRLYEVDTFYRQKGHSYTGEIEEIIALLESEPEPTKLTEPVRTIIGTAIQFGRPTGYSPTEEDWHEIGEICIIAESQASRIKELEQRS